MMFQAVHSTLSKLAIITSIVYAVWLMHRRKDLWGLDGECKSSILDLPRAPFPICFVACVFATESILSLCYFFS
jgi:hypothetical protein